MTDSRGARLFRRRVRRLIGGSVWKWCRERDFVEGDGAAMAGGVVVAVVVVVVTARGLEIKSAVDGLVTACSFQAPLEVSRAAVGPLPGIELEGGKQPGVGRNVVCALATTQSMCTV